METHSREDPGLQDGRDPGINEIQAVPNPSSDYSDLLHGPTLSLAAAPDQPLPGLEEHLYSILVHFPGFYVSQRIVTVKEKEMLMSIIYNTSNATRQLTTSSYPRVRLIPTDSCGYGYGCQTTVLILDENPERLRHIQRRLYAVQNERWSNLDESWGRRDLFFVRAWGERPVILMFKFNTWDAISTAPSLNTQRSVIDSVFERYPILAHYQHDSSPFGPRIAVGKAQLHRGPRVEVRSYPGQPAPSFTETYILVPLFNVDNHRISHAALRFAQDFAVEHSGGVDGPGLDTIAFQISVDSMDDPSLWFRSGGASWAAAGSW